MTRARPILGTGLRGGGRRLASGSKSLRRDTTGSMALEYALIAPAFIALMLGILHVALIYFAQEGLETAIEDAARIIMTGQAQTSTVTSGGTTHLGMSASDFKAAICSGMTAKDVNGKAITYAKSLPPFLTCDRLAVNVQIVPASCSSPTITTPTYTYNSSGAITSTGSGFGTVTCAGTGNTNAGLVATQGKLVILQLTYLWPTTSLPMGFNLVNQPNGNRLLLATYVFTVESYLCADGTTTSC